MKTLFTDNDGKNYNEDDVYESLLKVGADDCEILFLHSDIILGTPSKEFRRKEYVSAFFNAINRLGVKYLVVPTFTYSFCNNEVYDVKNSPTSMGALNEFIRKLPGRYRTTDPLLSFSVPNELKEKFSNPGIYSLGEKSYCCAINMNSLS